jgi:hypothetical protein
MSENQETVETVEEEAQTEEPINPETGVSVSNEKIKGMQEKLAQFCKDNNLEYVVAVADFNEKVQEDSDAPKELHVLFSSPMLAEVKADDFVSYNWLMRRAHELTNFACNMVDRLSERFGLTHIPRQTLQTLQQSHQQMQAIQANVQEQLQKSQVAEEAGEEPIDPKAIN